MSGNSAFFEAAYPAPVRILGLTLKPFCLGHRILLHHFGSSFVVGDGAEAVTYDDLALSVFVCHHTYEGACAALAEPDLDDVMADWERKLERPTLLQRLRLKPPDVIHLRENAEAFAHYVAESSKTPYYRYDPNKCSTVAAPTEQLLLTALMSDTNLSLSEILNMPYSLALHVWVTQKAASGALTLTDKDDVDEAREVGEMLAQNEDLMRQVAERSRRNA